MNKIKIFIKNEKILKNLKIFLDSYNFFYYIKEEKIYNVEETSFVTQYFIILEENVFEEFKILFLIFKDIDQEKKNEINILTNSKEKEYEQYKNETKKTIKNILNNKNDNYKNNKIKKRTNILKKIMILFFWVCIIVFLSFMFIIYY